MSTAVSYELPPLKSLYTYQQIKSTLRAQKGDSLGPRYHIWSELTAYQALPVLKSGNTLAELESERFARLNRLSFVNATTDSPVDHDYFGIPLPTERNIEDLLVLLRDNNHNFEESSLLRPLLYLLETAGHFSPLILSIPLFI